MALKWFTLATAAGDKAAAPYRNFLATQIAPAQLSEVDRQVAEWKPKDAPGTQPHPPAATVAKEGHGEPAAKPKSGSSHG
jgi:hypothetical protein